MFHPHIFMNHRSMLLIAAVVALVFSAVPAEAAKGARKGKRDQANGARYFARFDSNRDGSLDSTEAQRVRQAYEVMKKLDSNGDAQLSDSEISAAKVAQRKAGKRGKRKPNA